MSDKENWLTTEEVAGMIVPKVSEYTIREYCKSNRLVAKKTNAGRWLVLEQSVKDFNAGGEGVAPTDGQKSQEELAAIEGANIAEQERKRVEFEIARKLLEKGYQTLEQGLEDARQKVAEADRIVAKANETAEGIRSEAIEVSSRALEKEEEVNEREQVANEKLSKAVETEKNIVARVKELKGLVAEGDRVIEYHKTHVKGCRLAIVYLRNALYGWIEAHETIIGTGFYNYLGKMGDFLDSYIDNVPEEIKKE